MIDRGLLGQDKFKFNHLSGSLGSRRTWDHMRLNDYAFKSMSGYRWLAAPAAPALADVTVEVTGGRYFPLRRSAHVTASVSTIVAGQWFLCSS